MKILLLLFVCFASLNLTARVNPDDDWLNEVAKAPQEEKVSKLLNSLEQSGELTVQQAITYASDALKWAETLDNDKDLARLLNFLGNSYYGLGNYEQALDYYQKSLKVTMRLGNKSEIANLMQKIGIVSFTTNDYKKALLYFEQTLKIYQEIQYPMREAELFTSIGSIYLHWNEYEKAIENFDFARHIYQTLEYLPALENLNYLKGFTYYKSQQYEPALQWYEKALEINQKIENREGSAKLWNAMGQLYFDKEEMKNALDCYLMAYEIQLIQGDEIVLAQALNNLANVHKELGNYDKAALYLNESLELSTRLGLYLTQMDNYKLFYELHFLQNNSKKALHYYQAYVHLRDSVFLENKNNGSIAVNLLAQNKELSLKKELVQQKKNFKYLLLGASITIVILLLVVFFQQIKIKQLE